MSFGFIRKQSPASISEQRRRAAARTHARETIDPAWPVGMAVGIAAPARIKSRPISDLGHVFAPIQGSLWPGK